MIGKKFWIFLSVFVALSVFFTFKFVPIATKAQVKESGYGDVSHELAAQGTIRTCLSKKGNDPVQPDRNGNYGIVTLQLTGFCGSPTGCECVHAWGSNYLAEQDFGNCLEEELASGRCEKATNKTKCENDLKKMCNNMGNESEDGPTPGFKTCNIVKNNLAGNDESRRLTSIGNSNVLAATNNKLLPYGPIDITVSENTYIHTPFDFSAVGELPATFNIEELGLGEEPIDAANATQQLSTFSFYNEAGEFSIENLESKCISLAWDPYGRVFDAQSLEPILNTQVELIDNSTNQPVIMNFNLNFDFTGHDGVFNILVEREGDYKLTADAGSTDHSFVTDPKLSPNWSKIYSDLYLPGKVFREKVGIATHHDIPLQSLGAPFRGAVAEIVEGTLKSEIVGGHIIYRGRETFPMAKVCLLEEDTGRVVGRCVNANNIGTFSIAVPKDKVPQKKLKIMLEKVDLNNLNLYKENHTVETLHIYSSTPSKGPAKIHTFDPIFAYVEGYVYGANGEIIPKAKVSVKLLMNDALFYETQADDSGFFTIYTKDLPYYEYYFEFTDPKTGQKITKDTSAFAKENGSYLGANDINLVTASKNKQPIINPATGQLNQIVPVDSTSNNETDQSTKRTSPVRMEIFIIAIVLVLLVTATLGIVIYIKRQNKIIP